MRFNATLNVDFAQWKMVKLERENNLKDFKGMDEDTPKFGAGSEYNRELREEVRRKKYGIIAKRYKPEAQPWILKVGGKSGKKFRGIREGGVGENAAFYVFAHAPDGAIEAYPLNEWYNFQPIQRYKALSAEEAEHEFGRRKKVLNFFSLMLRKRMKGDDDEPEDPEETKLKKAAAKKGKELKISDMDADEWMESDDDSESEDEDKPKTKDEDDSGDEKKKKKKGPEKAKKKRNLDESAGEESDDGDEEGREKDYISESSDSESDLESKANKEMKSVAEEDALRRLLTSDEDSDEEKKEDDSDKEEDEAKNRKDAKDAKEAKEARDKKRKKLKKKAKDEKKDSSSELSSDSSDSEVEVKKKKPNGSSNNNSRSASPVDKQRKSMPTDLGVSENSNSPSSTPAKRPKLDPPPSLPPSFANVANTNSRDDYGITEEAVRRYLMRKPMTTTELLTKFKTKKTGVSSDKLVDTMTAILKKINPVKQTIQGKMYLSIKQIR